MNKDTSEIIHACLEIQGTGGQCKDCSVPKQGSCQVMVNVLNRLIYHEKAKNSLKGLPVNDIRDIISESIKDIQKGKCNGYTNAQFAGWVQAIAYRKISDYFRTQYKIKEHKKGLAVHPDDTTDEINNLENLPDLNQEEAIDKVDRESDIQSILAILRKKVPQNQITDKDVNFIETIYNGFKRGLSQEEIAKEIGVITNTLNVRLKRLREKLQKEGISSEP